MYKCGIFTQASVKVILHKKRSRKCQVSQKRGNSSVGRAQPCQGWGREFEPRFPLKGNCPGGGMVDALVSGACVERRAGSSPVLGTEYEFCIIMEEWRNW